jgi:GntR family transcriptional regulator/MocR family aminotransferase
LHIYRLAAENNIPIIEDDYDHEFHYRCQPLPPMAVDDEKQLIIYVSTLSKVLFPGARLGFIAVSKTFAKYVAQYRQLINHKNNIVMQSALAKWMASGGFTRHIRRTTRVNQQRRDSAVTFIQQQGLFSCITPDGGMALWLKIIKPNVKASQLCELAGQAGIFIQHENSFHVDKNKSEDCHIRVGFAGMSEKRFVEAMDKVGCLLMSLS